MDCINDEIIQQLLDGELSDAQKQTIMVHVKTCKTCKARLQQAIELQRDLSAVISDETCPSDKQLEAFAANKLEASEKAQVEEHILLCPRCDDYVELCQMSREELLAAEETQKAFFRRALAEDRARSVVKAVIKKLMPKESLDAVFGQLWDRAVDAFEKICDKGLEKLPQLGTGGELAGALGFSGAADPQMFASAIITLTTLATVYKADLLNESGNRNKIKELAGSFAEQLGAGKELKTRLMQTLPVMVSDDV
jgi:anti-sigma factor RsiW